MTADPGAAIHTSPEPSGRHGDLIFLDAVWRVYPRGYVTALHETTFSVRRSDYIAITGPSGSGKSTLLHLAGGLDRPTKGRVLFEGCEMQPPRQWTRLRARRIGFVFQSFHLIAGFTAAENVEVAMFGVERPERERKRRAAELLDRTGLSHRCRHYVSELSGGERQRVAIARALANSPDVILADEPTGNLDSRNAEGILELLEDLHRRDGISLMVVTHDPRVSQRAGRIVQLLDGQVISDKQRAVLRSDRWSSGGPAEERLHFDCAKERRQRQGLPRHGAQSGANLSGLVPQRNTGWLPGGTGRSVDNIVLRCSSGHRSQRS